MLNYEAFYNIQYILDFGFIVSIIILFTDIRTLHKRIKKLESEK